MSHIQFKIYDSEVELVDRTHDSSVDLELDFSENLSGFLRIGELSARLCEGRCIVDLRLLKNGQYTPELVLDKRLVPLPLMKKFGNAVEWLDCTPEYIRAASQRERALGELVATLEDKIKLLEDKVYGTVVL